MRDHSGVMSGKAGDNGAMPANVKARSTMIAGSPDAADMLYDVTFVLPEGERTVRVAANEFILAAGRRAGVELPSLCEQGWCITCAVWVLEGLIDQTASRRFYEQDRAAGFGLICTGQPRSNLRLRPGATEAMRENRLRLRLPVPRGTSSRIFPGQRE